jgi:hypothetical protein
MRDKMDKVYRIALVVVVIIAFTLGSCTNDTNQKPADAAIVKPHVKAIGEIVEFGEWRGEPLEWRVLDIQDGKALLITKNIVASRQYDRVDDYGDITSEKFDWGDVDVTWESSDIRKWLNREFIDTAFLAGEEEAILLSDITTPNNTKYGTEGGKDSQDKIFLLSTIETEEYFKDDEDRISRFTWTEEDWEYYSEILKKDLHIEKKDLKVVKESMSEDFEPGLKEETWWLRSPGQGNGYAEFVYNSGDYDNTRIYSLLGIRPAMWVAL